MQKRFWNKINRPNTLVFITLATLVFGVLIFLSGPVSGSDDAIFQSQVHDYTNVVSWVTHRYDTWSGRIFTEGFVYIFNVLPLFWHHAVSILLYAAMTLLLFGLYQKFSKNQSTPKKYFMLINATALIYLMHISTLSTGLLWVTGSMNYFWICVIGLASLYPLLLILKGRRLSSWVYLTSGLLLTAVASSSQEQVGAIIAGLTSLLLIYAAYGYSKEKIEKASLLWAVGWFITALSSFFISLRAPGNSLRLTSEVNYWLPDFYKVPLAHRIDYDVRWVLDALIHHSGFMFIILWSVIVLLTIYKKRTTLYEKLIAIVLGAAAILTLGVGHRSLEGLSHFYSAWNTPLPSKSAYIIFVFWLLVIAITIIAPAIIYRNIRGVLYSALIAASVASTALICLSPTMYASGWRTLFVPMFCAMIVIFLLLSDLFDVIPRKVYMVVVATILTLASAQYLLLVVALLKGSWLSY